VREGNQSGVGDFQKGGKMKKDDKRIIERIAKVIKQDSTVPCSDDLAVKAAHLFLAAFREAQAPAGQ